MPAARFPASAVARTSRLVAIAGLALALGLTALDRMPAQPPTPPIVPSWGGGETSDLASPPTVIGPRGSQDEATGQRIVDVRIVGNATVKDDKIIENLRTRRDREFDPELVQADKRRLITTGLFREVRVYRQPVSDGVVVTFEVFERPTIQYIRFLGERGVSERALLRESGLKVGEALNMYAIQESRRKIENYYHSHGFPKARVVVTEGNAAEHRGVVYQISEGPLQRIKKVSFIGNTIASDQRLKTQIQSKPGFLGYLFRGKVDPKKIDEDVERLTAYYRGLGFFRARVSRELEYDDEQKWLALRFIIDEGPRYVVNSVSFVGNQRFDEEALRSQLELESGEFFNLDDMNRDVNVLRDLYGGRGHIFADIESSPRFLIDQPGNLDLIYNIEEGEQFRVGRINVHIAGENPHTRESVVRNRLSLRTGDIVDIREVRASERRLKSSQLFENDPANGKSPRIVIRPPQLSDADGLVAGRGSSVRGQSPDTSNAPPRTVDLDIYFPAAQ